MENTLTNKYLYSQKNMNVQTLVRTLSPASPAGTNPTATVKLHPNGKIHVAFTVGQDGDIIKFLPPYKCKIIDAVVTNKTAVANGGVIIRNGSVVMITELACITAGAIARATNISPTPAEVEATEYIKILGVSSGLEAVIVFDIIQV
jgi:hypothetical protein